MSAQLLNDPRRKVLVVEDNRLLRELLADLLERSGLEVWTAPDGLAGIRALYHGPFDLILSDYRMPGMTGLEMAASVRKTDPITPIIIITAEPYALDPETVARAGITRVLPKPLKMNELLSICSMQG